MNLLTALFFCSFISGSLFKPLLHGSDVPECISLISGCEQGVDETVIVAQVMAQDGDILRVFLQLFCLFQKFFAVPFHAQVSQNQCSLSLRPAIGLDDNGIEKENEDGQEKAGQATAKTGQESQPDNGESGAQIDSRGKQGDT